MAGILDDAAADNDETLRDLEEYMVRLVDKLHRQESAHAGVIEAEKLIAEDMDVTKTEINRIAAELSRIHKEDNNNDDEEGDDTTTV